MRPRIVLFAFFSSVGVMEDCDWSENIKKLILNYSIVDDLIEYKV